ncbi:replication associated protein [Passion fruit chlorotic mottle virus]|uniref:Replication-associated protein n=1 Tax=Passion fruit chlorotic mottle virus TaxID=2162638 RepID=A0A2R4Q8U9_9GEMI|nr:replication associated protein [Passion fruit chlorotic mottle virus]AVY03272.1 replication associated protein [Passion fruit chlorotic mottle virus]
MPSTSNFRFSAKNIFLTFAQCFLPKEYILNFLKSKPSSFDIFFICVCFETHQNGDPHIHAMVQMRRRLDTTNPRFFDIKDELHDNRIFHPPFEPLRSPAASYRYIRKDNDFIEEGDFSTSRRPPSRDLQTIWRDILQISTDEDTFYRMVKEHRPMDYVLRWPAIQSFARDHFQRRFVPYTPQFIDFPNLPHHVRAWANRNILCVSTEFTCWARSMGLHNYSTGSLKFHNYNDFALYNVIDDISYSKITTEIMKSLLGCQKDFTVNIKYKPDRTINGGIPTIVLCNPDMDWRDMMSPDIRLWWETNVDEYTLSPEEKWFD